MCIWSIELIGVEKYGKLGEKPTFWAKFEHMYRYRSEVYRYTLFCFSNFDQFSYFSYNLLISYPI